MRSKRLILPISVFAGGWVAHYLWLWFVPETAFASESPWATIENVSQISPWSRYLAGKNYFLSYSYALSLSFAAVSFRRYREKQSCAPRRFVIGSLGLSGVLGIGSCFLIGCCGSPMLAVYLSLFGAGFLPFAKTLIAGITTLLIAGSWLWIGRSEKKVVAPVANCECDAKRDCP